jgi:hypothetical protein
MVQSADAAAARFRERGDRRGDPPGHRAALKARPPPVAQEKRGCRRNAYRRGQTVCGSAPPMRR